MSFQLLTYLLNLLYCIDSFILFFIITNQKILIYISKGKYNLNSNNRIMCISSNYTKGVFTYKAIVALMLHY